MNNIPSAQQQAIEKAYALLGEHFDGVIIGVSVEVPSDDGMVEGTNFYWHGGHTLALGLATKMVSRLNGSAPTEEEEP